MLYVKIWLLDMVCVSLATYINALDEIPGVS